MLLGTIASGTAFADSTLSGAVYALLARRVTAKQTTFYLDFCSALNEVKTRVETPDYRAFTGERANLPPPLT